ncbi:polysaccharide deacetylase family protein [Streptomyces sp. NPDC054887]
MGKLFGAKIRRIPTTRRVVALTFNAAWDTTGVATALNVLRRHKAPATFFLTGQYAERHPMAARAMAAEHGIGNHSYSHPQFDGLTRWEVEEEVLRADRAIRQATGVVPLPFFRFPYSATTPQGIADVNALGFADIEFTADTKGYLGTAGGMTMRKTVNRALDALTPGAILQMHVGTPDGHGSALDVQALSQIINGIHARGYQITDLRILLNG